MKSNSPNTTNKIIRGSRISHSQNFLRKAELVQGLVKKSSLRKDDTVIEIGSGTGIITEALAGVCREVIAIEADSVLADTLKARFKTASNVKVHSGDFLAYNLPKAPYKIFSNIPFNITAEIIKKICDASNPPKDSYLIVQAEAAKKYTGSPYGKETLFSILHKPLFRFEIVHHFNKIDFSPVPQVNSVLLRIERLNAPLIENNHLPSFKDFVAYGFTSNKPTLKKGYKNVFGHIQFLKLADELRYHPDAKPTDLSFEQWLAMFKYFLVGVERFRQIKIAGALKKLGEQQKTLTKIHRTRIAKNWKRASY